MDAQISTLQQNFHLVKENQEEITGIFERLSVRISRLKTYYQEFMSRNSDKSMLIFGLDSFHFQHKLINFEFDNMRQFFRLVNNRMYGDYYKLLKIMREFITTHINDNTIKKSLPVDTYTPYKDLQPYREYPLTDLFDIHKQIITLLSTLNGYIVSRDHDLNNYQNKSNIGLNIDNFVTTFRHDNRYILDQTKLYMNYVEVFHNLHTQYLERFKAKINMMYTQINSDVSFESDGRPSPGTSGPSGPTYPSPKRPDGPAQSAHSSTSSQHKNEPKSKPPTLLSPPQVSNITSELELNTTSSPNLSISSNHSSTSLQFPSRVDDNTKHTLVLSKETSSPTRHLSPPTISLSSPSPTSSAEPVNNSQNSSDSVESESPKSESLEKSESVEKSESLENSGSDSN